MKEIKLINLKKTDQEKEKVKIIRMIYETKGIIIYPTENKDNEKDIKNVCMPTFNNFNEMDKKS